MTPISKTTTWSSEFKGFQIEILKVEWNAGDCYEYRVSRDGKTLIETESEYGSQAPAIADAFTWIHDEGDSYTTQTADAAEELQKITSYTITTDEAGKRWMSFEMGGSTHRAPITDDPAEPERVLKIYSHLVGKLI